MPRKPRRFIDNGYYHLIARGNNRLFVFEIPYGHQKFKSLLKESKSKFVWFLHHYCLMTNHFHLLGRIEKSRELPKLMQYLLFEYSRWFRKKTNYVGHLWQGRYKSPLIEKESYFLECGRYIERNPVRSELTKKPEDYPWSSCGYYARGRMDPLIDDDPYYQGLGPDQKSRQTVYRQFVGSGGPYDSLLEHALLETHF